MFQRRTLTLMALSCAATAAHAQYTQIDITSQTNANIQTYSNGGNYQLGGTMLNVGPVPFALALDQGLAGTTGVVQSQGGPYNYNFAANNVTGTVVYTLINTAWGSYGTNEGSIVVTDSIGDTATLTLIEGVNIRDHNNDGFVNTLSDGSVIPTYFVGGVPNSTGGQVRLDMQTLVLPSTFTGHTITNISFQGNAPGFPDGAAFLAGVTIGTQATPEPAPFAIFGIGLAGLLWKRRK